MSTLKRLEKDTQTLKANIRNVSASPALHLLEPSTREQVETQAQELHATLENAYDLREFYQYTVVDVIKNYEAPASGDFYSFLELIADAQTVLKKCEQQLKTIQGALQKLELSPAEERVYAVLTQHQQNGDSELIDIRESVGDIDDTIFWQALRSLWEKQLVAVQLEGKLLGSQTAKLLHF